MSTALTTKFLKVKLANPITTGAGTFGYGEEIKDFIDVAALGAVTVKGTSVEPWPGNPTPRIWETSSGMLNAIGLQNDGLEHFINDKLPRIRELGTKVIVSIFDKTPENYGIIAAALDHEPGIDFLEINLSCPNIKAGGITFCAKQELLEEVVKIVRANTKLPLIAKLSYNVADIVETAKIALAAGADGLSMINTVLGMAIDIKTRRPQIKNNLGGLSGPAIRPLVVAAIYKVRRALPDAAIIGGGGVTDWQSALELILAGANLVSIGTANFYNPRVCLEVIEGLEKYCGDCGIGNISELVGKVEEWV